MDNPPTNNDTPSAPPALSQAAGALKRRMRSGRARLWIGGAALVAAIALPSALFFGRPARFTRTAAGPDASFTLRKMDLVISSLLDDGTLVSPGSLEIKSAVEGQTTIVSVIPEGSVVTPEDVQNEKVLMELDSSALREKANQEEIAVEGCAAALTQARDSYEIQKNFDNNSTKVAELKAKFALMDLEKYLGATLTPRVLEGEITPAAFHEVAAESEVPADAPKPPEANGAPKPAWSRFQDAIRLMVRVVNGQEPVLSLRVPRNRPKGSALKLETLHLGGTARQDWRKFQTAIELASEDLDRAATTYQWSKRLGPKELGGAGYVPGTEVQADYLALKRSELQIEQAKLDLDIFLRYELPKQTELLLSAYQQTCEDLELEHARVRADLDKADAQVKAAETAYRREKVRLDKLNEQIAACLIYATRPGIVAYPQPQPSTSPALTATPAPAGASADKIVEGATVHERQALMTILADGKLAVNVKVHKASVNRIQRGQTARIVLNGFPNRGYSGRVQKVLVVPDTLNAGRMPDPKDFNVIVSIDNPPADLKPGMSARVEILIAKLTDVLAAPVQAVATVNGRQVCYVAGKGGAEPRVVKTGLSNADYVEITGGLEPGEKVLLRAPTAVGPAPAVSAAAAVTALADDGEAKRPKPASLEAQADAEGPKAAVAPKNPTP
jgi:multidrug resistance efflux pump